MCTRHITGHMMVFLLSALLVLSGSAEIGLCFSEDHVGAWAASAQDGCCSASRGVHGLVPTSVSGDGRESDCFDCMDVHLPSLTLPLRVVPVDTLPLVYTATMAPEAWSLPALSCALAEAVSGTGHAPPSPLLGDFLRI
ncbi:MAG: hypothetical protein HYV26_08020 [Candidatus Hydrogenedentes bacterium]|nr:hypothetical protein [Candidatus Hydrogenedentota bacterium]